MKARFRPNLAAPGVVPVAVALLLSCGVASAQETPDGWAVFSRQTPDDVALRCANYSRTWKVSLYSEKLVIVEGRDRSGMSSIEYGSGKLEGLDHGEFGGGLWWLDGASKTKISDENVHGFVRTQFGTLAFVGLDHMSLRSGKVLIIGGGDIGPPSTTVLADLGESPGAFALAPDGSVVLVTSSKIYRIKSPGVIETIGSAEDTPARFGGKFGGLYPTSVAVLRSGAIYVGMRHFVIRLTPKGSSYAEDWLVPSHCRRFVDLGFQFGCVCGGLPKELLKERLTFAEAEARLKPGFAPFTEKAWDNLRHQMQPCDELWTWRHSRWAGGIALVRKGEVVASFNAMINSSVREF
jgi:hypothetical protein